MDYNDEGPAYTKHEATQDFLAALRRCTPASRRRPPSQIDRLLAALAPGHWISTSELLRVVPCIVHSRIAEARKRGHAIEHRTIGKGASGSQYRLVGSLSEREAA